jgi:hypothetical protein
MSDFDWALDIDVVHFTEGVHYAVNRIHGLDDSTGKEYCGERLVNGEMCHIFLSNRYSDGRESYSAMGHEWLKEKMDLYNITMNQLRKYTHVNEFHN